MRAFQIKTPGLFTLLQDLGRPDFQAQGVSPSGAADELSFTIANALVHNDINTGALEFTLTGPTLYYQGDKPTYVAVTGDVQMTLNDTPCDPYQCLQLNPGDTLAIRRVISGARGYLAVAGGFNIKPVLGSVSTFTRAAIGGFNGRTLAKGDYLPLNNPRQIPNVGQRADRFLPHKENRPVRIVWGPQAHFFDNAAKAAFTRQTYHLSTACDRMGYRLEGEPISAALGHNIVSDPISRGSIQVPGNGQPIVAMSDRQTSGGYPKIATLIRADMARMGQMKPGDSLTFEAVSVNAAEDLWCARQQELKRWLRQLRAR